MLTHPLSEPPADMSFSIPVIVAARRPFGRAGAALALLSSVLGPAAAQAQAQAAGSETQQASSARNEPAAARARPSTAPGYRAGAGDELNFRFTYTPELNTVAVVRADGKVSLPLLGEVAVAGLSLREVADNVQAALAQRVRRPEVVINVQGNLPSQRVFVGGEVTKPGVQPLAGSLTAMQAVLAADGLKDTAQPREVTVLRTAPGGERLVFRVDMKALMEGRQPADDAQDVVLAPYDVVIVPKSGIANVGLWVDQYIRRVLPVSLGFSYSLGNGVVR